MIDVEPLVESSFARLVPERALSPDWDDVLRRSGTRRPRRRRVLLASALGAAAVLAAVVSPLGAAVGGPIGDFSTWLRGDPGAPAPEAEQRAFERNVEKTWGAFPVGATLRELLTTSEEGVDYALYGYRLNGSLCLRLQATGAAAGSASECAPLSELRARPQPVLVLEVDQPIGTLPGVRQQIGPDSFTLPRASVSFGIVADGVSAVHLRSDDGTRDARVGANSFLDVHPRPPAGSRVRAVTADLTDGSTRAIPFAEAPFDTLGAASHGTLHGPTAVERRLDGGTIGWLERREERGRPFPGDRGRGPLPGSQLVFGRVVQPNPQVPLGVGLSLAIAPARGPMRGGLYVCMSLVEAQLMSAGCSPADEIFERSPVTFGLTTRGGGDQYSYLDGIASDDVAGVRLYLGTGETVDLPLVDNAFLTQVSRAKFPLRLVGYDASGRIVANSVVESENGPSGPAYRPKSGATWQQAVSVDGASLWTVTSAAGGVCWKLRYRGGSGADGCTPPDWTGELRNDVVPLAYPAGGPDPVVLVEAKPDVARVEIRYRSGATELLAPENGFLLHAIPTEHVAAGDPIDTITAYDASGAELGHLTVRGR
ncbi:MAG TPA: hypothetical protein VFI10_01450 [Gaiellaceae bacterium]|jgi:hypothetical protein|nr:hypothetical protein [Gaiellaceae bacterium]